MGCLRTTPTVAIDTLTIGGACLVAALLRTAVSLPFDLWITSGTDGAHSGPDDPHKHGAALDVRSHDFHQADKDRVLQLIMSYLSQFTTDAGGDGRIIETSGGFATQSFFGFLEDAGGANEHYHFQIRNGHAFPPRVLA